MTTDTNKPTVYVLRGITPSGETVYYTGRSGARYVSPNLDDAFTYIYLHGAQVRATMFNRLGLAVRFTAVPFDVARGLAAPNKVSVSVVGPGILEEIASDNSVLVNVFWSVDGHVLTIACVDRDHAERLVAELDNASWATIERQ